MINVSSDHPVIITMDPLGYTWSGIGLFDDCPDVGTLLDSVTGSTSTPRVMTYTLLAAESPYYIMVDSWPSPACIDFELTIESALKHDVGVEEIISPFAGPPAKGEDFYAYMAYDGTSTYPEGPFVFDSDDPGTITMLTTGTTDFIAAGTWVVDTWYGGEYGTNNLYTIDEGSGAMTLIGAMAMDSVTGIAYDDNSDTMYAMSYGTTSDLYTVDYSTATATFVGSAGTGGLIIDIACDNDGNLFGIDLIDDSLYSIDSSTGVATLIGSTGHSLNYGQGMEYDKNNDILYLAAYTVAKKEGVSLKLADPNAKAGGGLYICDVSDGSTTHIGDFPNSLEATGLAIPYSLVPPECWPQGMIDVEAVVENYGDYTESFFDVTATITHTDTMTVIYSETENVASLAPGANITVTFDLWDTLATAPYGGNFSVEICTELADDQPNNDCEDEDGCLEPGFLPPIAKFAGEPYVANVDNDFTVNFDGTPSYDPDGGVLTYHWDFGDGTTGAGATPTHVYPHSEVALTAIVTLTVTDDELDTDDNVTTVAIAGYDDDPPIVQMEYPRGGEELGGTVVIEWFAIDSEDGDSPAISLYYSGDGQSSWNKIASGLVNTIGAGAYKDRGQYSWSTSALSDGNYFLRIYAFDSNMNSAKDTKGPVIISNHNSGLLVSYVAFSEDYVKNGDSLEIYAGITNGMQLTVEEITADLTGLGYGENMPADSFDGLTATWNIENIECTPSDGPITITVTIDEVTNSKTLTADNTQPTLNIIKPENALYFFNAKLFKANKPIIIGAITLEVNAADQTGIQKIEVYIDDELKQTITDGSNYYMNIRIIGRHNLKINAYDNTGNINEYTQSVLFLNLFGNN